MPIELNKNHRIHLEIESDKGSDIQRQYAAISLKDISQASFNNIKHWTNATIDSVENPRAYGSAIEATCTLKIHDLNICTGATTENLVGEFSRKSATVLNSMQHLHEACMASQKADLKPSLPEANPQ